jgi:3-dehydroquinate dehydratase
VIDRPVILLLSGPNLNLLGQREPEVYGRQTIDDHVAAARVAAEADGFAVEHVQANAEGDLIDAIQLARGRCAAIIVNPGALTHYAWGLHDALAMFDGPIVAAPVGGLARGDGHHRRAGRPRLRPGDRGRPPPSRRRLEAAPLVASAARQTSRWGRALGSGR